MSKNKSLEMNLRIGNKFDKFTSLEKNLKKLFRRKSSRSKSNGDSRTIAPMNTISNERNPECTQFRMYIIPNGYEPELTQSRVDTILNGHYPD